MKRKIIIVACGLLLVACGLNANQAWGQKSNGVISSDQELYEVCSKDINTVDFENTKCSFYVQGYLSSYVITYINVISKLKLSNEKQESALKDFSKCNTNNLFIKDIVKSFLIFMKEKQSKKDAALQHPGSFFWVYFLSCGKPSIVYEKIKNEMQEPQNSASPEQCPGNVIIEIENIKLAVPRYAVIRKETGESVFGLKRKCDIKRIENVQNAVWPEPEYFEFIKAGMGATQYQMMKEQIDEARKSNNIKIIDSGIQKIILKGSEIYILPESQSSTANNEPIVFNCSGNLNDPNISKTANCFVSYEHPAGFKFSYRFFRHDYAPDKFLELDQHKREEISKMIQSAQAHESEKGE